MPRRRKAVDQAVVLSDGPSTSPSSSDEAGPSTSTRLHCQSSYFLFSSEYVEKMRAQQEENGKTYRDLLRDAAEAWKSLGEDGQRPYRDRAKQARDELKQTQPPREPKRNAKAVVHTRCSPRRFCTVTQRLNDAQRAAVAEMGFASLLRLESHQLMRTLSLWLVERFDPHRRRLDLGERGIIPISPYDVGLVLGIPVGGDDVPINGRDSDVRSIRVEFSSNHGIDVSTLEVKLAERDAGPSFKRAFLLFALGTLLCPTRGLKVSPRFLHAVYHIEQVHRYNWAGLVLNCLANAITVFKSAGEEHTRDGLGGCLLFLYMFYLDRIDSGRAPPRHILPRVAAWTAGDLSAAAEVDRQGTGVYGACPVILVTRSEPTPTLVQETPHWDDLVRGMGIDPFGVPVADYIDEFRQVVAQAAYRLSQQVIHKAMNRGYPYISPAGRVPYNPCNPPDQTTATPGAHPANVVPPPHDDPSAPTTSSHSSQTSMQEDLNTSSIAYLHRRRHQHFKRPAIQIALNSNNASAIDSATIDVDASSTARTLTIGAPIDVNSINPNIAANPNANANGIAQFADPTAAHDPVSPPNPIPLHTALMMVPNNASRRPRHRAR